MTESSPKLPFQLLGHLAEVGGEPPITADAKKSVRFPESSQSVSESLEPVVNGR
jgi:hypothetical protein